MALVLTSSTPLEENYAELEDDATAGHDQGAISWNNPIEEAGGWKVTFEGLNVEGDTINSTTIDIDEEYTINPTKVVQWLVQKATEYLCPQCGLP